MCNAKGLKYISWGYDCPFNVRNIEKTLGNPCNYVFCFDRVQAQTYQSMGFDTVYHLPLGINTLRYQKVNPSSEQKKKYAAQISFIGSLYEGQYPALTEISTKYAKGYMDAVINCQQQLYGAYILNDVIDNNLVRSMNEHFIDIQPDTKFQLDKAGLVHILDQETSRRERLVLLSLLGTRFDTKLYSTQEYSVLRGVKCCGPVNYYNEMPYVFASSAINLNISVKGIQSGIPQRALDVMASGGFLLSNYQQELVYIPLQMNHLHGLYEPASRRLRQLIILLVFKFTPDDYITTEYDTQLSASGIIIPCSRRTCSSWSTRLCKEAISV